MTGHERRPDMHLTVLGAGTAVPSPRRSPAGYLLRVAGEALLFDAGPGTLARLAVAGVSLAFRVEAAGRTMVYSGDAVESEGLARLARGADTFVCECSFPRGWRTADHVTADGAGRMAQAAGARRLILSHLYPPAQEADVAGQARAEYEGEVIVAVDGTTMAV